MNLLTVTIQVKAAEQLFSVVLFLQHLLFTMSHTVVLNFKSMGDVMLHGRTIVYQQYNNNYCLMKFEMTFAFISIFDYLFLLFYTDLHLNQLR